MDLTQHHEHPSLQRTCGHNFDNENCLSWNTRLPFPALWHVRDFIKSPSKRSLVFHIRKCSTSIPGWLHSHSCFHTPPWLWEGLSFWNIQEQVHLPGKNKPSRPDARHLPSGCLTGSTGHPLAPGEPCLVPAALQPSLHLYACTSQLSEHNSQWDMLNRALKWFWQWQVDLIFFLAFSEGIFQIWLIRYNSGCSTRCQLIWPNHMGDWEDWVLEGPSCHPSTIFFCLRHLPYFAVYNEHFFAHICEGEIRICIIHG